MRAEDEVVDTCGTCAEPLPPGAPKCTNCGTWFVYRHGIGSGPHPVLGDGRYRCGRCNALLSHGADHCRACGIRFFQRSGTNRYSGGTDAHQAVESGPVPAAIDSGPVAAISGGYRVSGGSTAIERRAPDQHAHAAAAAQAAAASGPMPIGASPGAATAASSTERIASDTARVTPSSGGLRRSPSAGTLVGDPWLQIGEWSFTLGGLGLLAVAVLQLIDGNWPYTVAAVLGAGGCSGLAALLRAVARFQR